MMEVKCRLCGARLASKIVGQTPIQRFSEIWPAFNMHIATKHRKQGEGDGENLAKVAGAIAALRVFSTFMEVQGEPGDPDHDFMLNTRDQQRKALLDFIDGVTPIPDATPNVGLVNPNGGKLQ
jgi:hypothetical protein